MFDFLLSFVELSLNCNPSFCPLYNYLLRSYYAPGTVLSTGDQMVNKVYFLRSWYLQHSIRSESEIQVYFTHIPAPKFYYESSQTYKNIQRFIL